MYVCLCHAVTERHIEQAVDCGATQLRDLRRGLRVATSCGQCASCAKEYLQHSLTSRHRAADSLLTVSASTANPAMS